MHLINIIPFYSAIIIIMEVENISVKTGALIGEDKGERLISGVYRFDGKLYASKYGTLQRRTETVDGKECETVSVESSRSGERGSGGLNVGDILICRVVRIREDGAEV